VLANLVIYTRGIDFVSCVVCPYRTCCSCLQCIYICVDGRAAMTAHGVASENVCKLMLMDIETLVIYQVTYNWKLKYISVSLGHCIEASSRLRFNVPPSTL